VKIRKQASKGSGKSQIYDYDIPTATASSKGIQPQMLMIRIKMP
jgi:hypothetical protein